MEWTPISFFAPINLLLGPKFRPYFATSLKSDPIVSPLILVFYCLLA